MNFLDGYGSLLMQGAIVTVQVAFCALLLGLFLAVLTVLIEFIAIKPFKLIFSGMLSLIRGLPELLVLFTIYFGASILLSKVLHHPVQVSTFIASVVALGLIFASYAVQTLRGAFLIIPKAQIETGKALGLSMWFIFKKILLPQAWRHALPGLGNLWLVLLKDTALVSLIGLGDLMNKATLAASTTFQPFKFYVLAALIFLILTSISQILLNRFIHIADRSL